MFLLRSSAGFARAALTMPLVALAFTTLSAPAAHAQLTGKTVQLRFIAAGNVIIETHLVTVGPGTEYTGLDNLFDVDVSDTSLLLTVTSSRGTTFFPSPFTGISLTDINSTIPSFTSVTLDPSTTTVGFNPSRISFDSDNINLNYQALTVAPGQIVRVNFTTAAAAAPEPGSLALLLPALPLAGLILRRRKTH